MKNIKKIWHILIYFLLILVGSKMIYSISLGDFQFINKGIVFIVFIFGLLAQNKLNKRNRAIDLLVFLCCILIIFDDFI